MVSFPWDFLTFWKFCMEMDAHEEDLAHLTRGY